MASEKAAAVLAAARDVFLRYGYRRVTMGDLAEAAQMSRPALYAVFPSKEQIFVELIRRLIGESLDEVRRGFGRPGTVEAKLELAFEVWCVRPFELVRRSPDAADLLESTQEFAADLNAQGVADFEVILAELLEPLTRPKAAPGISPREAARLLRTAAVGFKGAARDAADLRRMIAQMCSIVLSSLRGDGPPDP